MYHKCHLLWEFHSKYYNLIFFGVELLHKNAIHPQLQNLWTSMPSARSSLRLGSVKCVHSARTCSMDSSGAPQPHRSPSPRPSRHKFAAKSPWPVRNCDTWYPGEIHGHLSRLRMSGKYVCVILPFGDSDQSLCHMLFTSSLMREAVLSSMASAWIDRPPIDVAWAFRNL